MDRMQNASLHTHDCIIIGGGPAGLSAARSLVDAGLSVRIFDKGRGPGGRLSSRRADGKRFDHGAREITLDPQRDQSIREEWINAGVACEWSPRMLDGKSYPPRLVAVPAMNSLIRYLSEGLDLDFGVRIESIEYSSNTWILKDQHQDTVGIAHSIVLAIPAPQAIALLGTHANALVEELKTVEFNPIWAVLFDGPLPEDIGFDAAVHPHPAIEWLGGQATRPEREHDGAWVAHATTTWSLEHLEENPEDITQKISKICSEILNTQLNGYATAHRWRYARASRPLGKPCLVDSQQHLALAGDWCQGTTISDAMQSGEAAAAALRKT